MSAEAQILLVVGTYLALWLFVGERVRRTHTQSCGARGGVRSGGRGVLSARLGGCYYVLGHAKDDLLRASAGGRRRR